MKLVKYMSINLLETIKKKGYWKIIVRPVERVDIRIKTTPELKEVITKSNIRLRGWDYPHINRESGIEAAPHSSVMSLENWPDMGHLEYWQYYQDGQFIHFFSMLEDYRMTEEKKEELANSYVFSKLKDKTIDNKYLSVLNALYSVTEIYLFTKKMIENISLDRNSNIEIIIELHGVKNRTLCFWDHGFRELFNAYTCKYNPIVLKSQYCVDELVDKYANLSLEKTMQIFNEFNWNNPDPEVFAKDQKKLLERRL